MDTYFTYDKVRDLVTKHGWEMVPDFAGWYVLRQKDAVYMKTVSFKADANTVRDFCIVKPKADAEYASPRTIQDADEDLQSWVDRDRG